MLRYCVYILLTIEIALILFALQFTLEQKMLQKD